MTDSYYLLAAKSVMREKGLGYAEHAQAAALISIAESLKELVAQGKAETDLEEEYRTGVRERPDPLTPAEQEELRREVLREHIQGELLTKEQYHAYGKEAPDVTPGNETTVP